MTLTQMMSLEQVADRLYGGMIMRQATLAIVGALIAASSPALADTYRFDVNDPAATLGSQPFQNYSFTINTSTSAPSAYDAGSTSYAVTDSGSSTYGSYTVMDTVQFYTSADGGGFSNNFTTTFETGAQVFGGSTSAPTFANGTYHFDTDQPGGGETLQVTDISAPAPVSAAPEPGAWVMMLGGVGAMGMVLRSRRRRWRLARVTAA